MAQELLAGLQAPSFARNREFCGMIGRSTTGQFIASKPRQGRRDSCRPRDPNAPVDLIASYHTHGRFDPEIDAEWPSVNDVETDMDQGINGWIATPGGRLWFVDGTTGTSRQICGLGCLPKDPNFVEAPGGPPPRQITLPALIAAQSD